MNTQGFPQWLWAVAFWTWAVLSPMTAHSQANASNGIPNVSEWQFQMSKTLAMTLAESSDWTLALPYFRALSAKTQDWNFLMAHAKIELQQGNLEEATTTVQHALALNPQNPRILVLAGQVAYDAGQLEQASMYLQKAMTLQPHNVQAMASLARLRFAQRDWADAVVWYERLMRQAEPTSELLVKTAMAYENLGDLSNAERYFKQNLETHPNRVLALLPLERFYIRQNDTARAAQLAKEREKLQKKDDDRALRDLLPSSK